MRYLTSLQCCSIYLILRVWAKLVSQYTYSDELRHYGVKGMKWGVRREIGTRAKAGAMYERLIKTQTKRMNKLEKMKSTKGLTNRQNKNLKDLKKTTEDFIKKRNTLIKDISEKDIEKGRRAINAMQLLGAASSIPQTAALIKGNRILEREKNRY